MTAVFWIRIAVVAYVYVGYPAVLCVWARLWPKPYAAGGAPRGVSIVVAARNEGARLAARIDNLLSLDYPATLRQIIIVCDGCTDDTHDVLKRYSRFVDVVTLPPSGKAAALNAGLERARFEIVVFADARQMFASNALSELVAPFEDPTVGAVTGELLLDCESAIFANRRDNGDRRRRGHAGELRGVAVERRSKMDRRRRILSTIAEGVGFYWRYEKQLRRFESCIGSTLGATGAIYAARRRLWQPLPADTLLDDVLAPMRVVMSGFRAVFNERALAFDRATVDADAESQRKIRTLAGNYQILRLEPGLLLPWRNPVWLQYVSHKIGRLAVPYAVLAIFWASIVLSDRAFYRGALWTQVAFYMLAGYGALLELTSRVRASIDPTEVSAGTSTRVTAQEAAS